MNGSFMNLFIESVVAGGALVFIYLLGSIIHTRTSGYTKIFYSLLYGFIGFTSIYAVVLSSGETILTVLLAALVLYIIRSGSRIQLPSLRINAKKMAECLFYVILFVLLLNFFPESAYKQQDSFFYLKISEILSASGQENTSHYQNLLSDRFHGAEAYHYVELWFNNALLHAAQHILPGIYIFRIVTFSIICVMVIYGLFALAESFTYNKLSISTKLVCICFIFFIADLSPYLSPAVQRFLVFGFENNMLERPNFRISYLFLLPVLMSLRNKENGLQLTFFLICFSLINPIMLIVTCPAFLLYILVNKQHGIRKMDLTFYAAFVLMYAGFYLLFGTRGVPPMYDFNISDLTRYYSRSWKYVILTTFTSMAYAAVVIGSFYLLTKRNRNFLRENQNVFFFAALFVAASVVIARLGDHFENFYQVAFNGYMVTTLIVLLLCLSVAKTAKLYPVFFCCIFLGSFIFYKMHTPSVDDIFHQNSRHAYSGTHYSQEYIEEVTACFQNERTAYGAYIADSAYYRNLYYSARNPVVYHLPITYIISAKTNNNIDFCLSDKADILYDPEENLETNNYLRNALSRSWFQISFDGNDHGAAAQKFIRQHRLRYLIMTPGADMRVITGMSIEKKIIDKNTGETFLLITH